MVLRYACDVFLKKKEKKKKKHFVSRVLEGGIFGWFPGWTETVLLWNYYGSCNRGVDRHSATTDHSFVSYFIF